MTLVSMIGSKWKFLKTLKSPIHYINASLFRQLFEDYNYLLVSFKSHCRVFSTFYFCLISDYAVFLFLLMCTFNTIAISLIWSLKRKRKCNPSNLVPHSPSEGEANNDVLCHCGGGKETCHVAWGGAGRGVCSRDKGDQRDSPEPPLERPESAVPFPQSVSTDGCSLLQA